MLQIGSVVDGKYKILNMIGQGGMSTVYLAMNERANKQWAIKEVRKDGVQNFDVVRQGLIVETDMLKKLHHPSLPSIIDVIDADDTFLIVMDYIEGISLKQALWETGAQPQELVIEWAKELCDVLGYLHSRIPAIIYRDMKPANVILKPDGHVTLIDFGTAREYKNAQVEDTQCLGTRGYAAPEQYGGRGQTDARTDIYCLGATIYHLVTGQNPSEYPYTMVPIRQIDPGLSTGLEQIILKCTQPDPSRRYQSCAELLYDLEHYDELDISHRRGQKRKLGLFAASALLTLILTGASVFGRVMEKKTENQGCDAYIQAAERTSGSERIDNYKSAISLNPSNEAAYLGYLDTVMEDGRLEDSEYQMLLQCLNDRDGGRSNANEAYLKTNEAGYVKFCYELGVDCYYSYGDNGNKAYAAKWLSVVLEKDAAGLHYSMPEDERNKAAWAERADILYHIGSYYNQLDQVDKSGDSTASYATYWMDLMELLDNDRGRTDGSDSATFLRLCIEITGQIQTNASKFKNAGITEDEMRTAIGTIREKSDGIEAGGELQKELKAQLAVNAELAEEKLLAVFSGTSEGGS